ncbi:MAG TPA: c-type cytochrome [Gemmatimonadaceae bacterium]|nr:c-type cytochrome [Gemmatimonadaceae bacterium]
MTIGPACAVLFALSAIACGGQKQGTTTAQGGNVGSSSDTSGYVTESPNSNKNPAVTSTEITHEFTGNVADANAGRVLFLTHNCVGCHGGLAGGAMGPSLRDTTWKYGGSDQGIAASIRDGRPGGMPAWGHANVVGQENTLSNDQIQKLITYIHSMRTKEEPTFFFWAERQKGAGTVGGDTGKGATSH